MVISCWVPSQHLEGHQSDSHMHCYSSCVYASGYKRPPCSCLSLSLAFGQVSIGWDDFCLCGALSLEGLFSFGCCSRTRGFLCVRQHSATLQSELWKNSHSRAFFFIFSFLEPRLALNSFYSLGWP